MAPTTLPWTQYTEAIVGRSHPTLTDTDNRALRAFLSSMGVAPDSVFTGFPGGHIWVDTYGAIGDGVTDDTTAIQTAENARVAGQTLRFTPGKTYIVDSAYNGTPATATGLLQIKVAGIWDATGATIKYGSGLNLTTGSDGGAYGMVNALVGGVTVRGTFDGASKAKTAVAMLGTQTGFQYELAAQNFIDGGFALRIAYAVSVDVSGIAIGVNRAKNVAGFLRLPQAPFMDNSQTIQGHSDIVAVLWGGQNNNGNSTGLCLVTSPSQFATWMLRPDLIGIPQFMVSGDANTRFGDFGCHDAGIGIVENYGTSILNSSGFGMVNSDLLGYVAKFAAGAAWSHANIGSDGSSPSVVIIARAQGQADIDFDYNPGGGTAGGRLIEKLITPTEAVLVSGVDARTANLVNPAALTAARVVGAPLNPRKGQRIVWTITQDGTGGRAVTWNAVFKLTWSDAGNAAGKRSSIATIYDSTNWNQDGAQTPYV